MTSTRPILRTLIATATLALTWFMAMDIVDAHGKKLAISPVLAFLAANVVVLLAIPEGAIHQFMYYTLRQVFLAFMLIYMFYAVPQQPKEAPCA